MEEEVKDENVEGLREKVLAEKKAQIKRAGSNLKNDG